MEIGNSAVAIVNQHIINTHGMSNLLANELIRRLKELGSFNIGHFKMNVLPH